VREEEVVEKVDAESVVAFSTLEDLWRPVQAEAKAVAVCLQRHLCHRDLPNDLKPRLIPHSFPDAVACQRHHQWLHCYRSLSSMTRAKIKSLSLTTIPRTRLLLRRGCAWMRLIHHLVNRRGCDRLLSSVLQPAHTLSGHLYSLSSAGPFDYHTTTPLDKDHRDRVFCIIILRSLLLKRSGYLLRMIAHPLRTIELLSSSIHLHYTLRIII